MGIKSVLVVNNEDKELGTATNTLLLEDILKKDKDEEEFQQKHQEKSKFKKHGYIEFSNLKLSGTRSIKTSNTLMYYNAMGSV